MKKGTQKPQQAPWKFVLAGSAVILTTSLVVFINRPQPEPRFASLDRNSNVPIGTASRVMELVSAAEENKDLTPAEWRVFQSMISVAGKTHEIGPKLCMAGAFVKPEFRHREEVLKVVHEFLDQGFKDGNIPALLALRRHKDPRFEARMQEVLSRSEPETAALIRKTFKGA